MIIVSTPSKYLKGCSGLSVCLVPFCPVSPVTFFVFVPQTFILLVNDSALKLCNFERILSLGTGDLQGWVILPGLLPQHGPLTWINSRNRMETVCIRQQGPTRYSQTPEQGRLFSDSPTDIALEVWVKEPDY